MHAAICMQPRGRSHIERSRVERGRMQAAVFHTYTHKCARVHVNTNGAGSVSRRVGGVTDGGGGDLSLRAVSWRRPARDPWPLRRINHEAVPSRFFISRAESYCPAPPPPPLHLHLLRPLTHAALIGPSDRRFHSITARLSGAALISLDMEMGSVAADKAEPGLSLGSPPSSDSG